MPKWLAWIKQRNEYDDVVAVRSRFDIGEAKEVRP
jgi:hypothetical protein